MKTTISVSKQHLRDGQPGEADFCPAALALTDAGFNCPSVYDQTIMWVRDGKLVQVPTPENLKHFMEKYDDAVKPDPKIPNWNVGMFEPFDFEIDPDQAI